jgi:endonuclease-3
MAEMRETKKTKRMREIIGILKEEYPRAGIQLEADSPWKLMVAVILSAQCTDKRVNMITKDLFAQYSEVEDYVVMPVEELEQLIYSAGFYKAKAKNIKAAAKMLVEDFESEMPSTMEELLKLPGVGRKSANVILGHCFDIPGIVVDTHVKRLAFRMGFTDTKDPEKVEFALMKIIEKEEWVLFTHLIINHGRNVCTSRKPKCEKCRIADLCDMKGL